MGLRVTLIFALVFLLVVLLTDALLYVNFRSVELTRGIERLAEDAQLLAMVFGADAHGRGTGEAIVTESLPQSVANRIDMLVLNVSGSAGRVVWQGGGVSRIAAETVLAKIATTEIAASTPGRVRSISVKDSRLWLADASFTDGTLTVVSSLPDSHESIRTFALQLFGLSSLVATVGFWVMLMVGAGITRPILMLTRAADRIEGGDLTARVGLARSDEIGALLSTFDAMAERIEATERGRARFMSSASHELKTPLASIKAVVEALLAEASVDAEVRGLLSAVDGEVDRMADLVRALTTHTRLEEVRPALQRVAVRKVVERMQRLLSPRAREMGTRIEVDCPHDLVLESDPHMLDELLLNLLDNALRHGGPGIVIRIRAGAGEIRVTNTGPPIPAQVLNHIFEPFVSGDPSHSRRLSGSGLGLAIVQRIAMAHGWSVRAESLDRKTSFVVVIDSSLV